MKASSTRGATQAFNVIELLVVIGLLTLLIILLMPRLAGSGPGLGGRCQGNLRQIDFGLRSWATDHNDRFPPQVSITNGGSMEFIVSNSPALHFQTISNYVGGMWRIFICPADMSRRRNTSFASGLADSTISYFISVDATPALTNAFLAGDRNLQVGSQPLKPGLLTLTTNTPLFWTRSDLHSRREGVPGGNILFVDGHCEFLRVTLTAALQRQGLPTNRLAVP